MLRRSLPSPTLLQRGPEGTHKQAEPLTLTTRGSGWAASSWSSSTCTGPPFTMLPPRKSWVGRGREQRVVGGEDHAGGAARLTRTSPSPPPLLLPRKLGLPMVLAQTIPQPRFLPSLPLPHRPRPFVPSSSRSLSSPASRPFPILPGPHLSREAGPPRVRDVILSQVPVQPVAEVEEAVIQGQQDVGNQAWGGRGVQRL